MSGSGTSTQVDDALHASRRTAVARLGAPCEACVRGVQGAFGRVALSLSCTASGAGEGRRTCRVQGASGMRAGCARRDRRSVVRAAAGDRTEKAA
eukprot:scaffold71971_cov69-Phaeocystis_antarctica.AAC.1